MWGRRLHRLFNPFLRKTTSVNHFSKRLQTSKKPNDKFQSIWSQMFGKYLLVTNTLGSGLLVGIGDALAQYWERLTEDKSLDYTRSKNMVITGLIIGPIQHGFYYLLDRALVGNTRRVILQKLVIDQLIMSSIYISLFFYITGLLEGRSLNECHTQLSEKFLYTWALDCCFFPAIQFLNFRFFTAAYRVVFINLVNCTYVMMLSYINNTAKNPVK
ncbi:hypothetical protein KR032_008011 [Drosophila birchii]|nr:hypothetical protein KR032_008011 [Drosophila birchii]